MGNSPVKPNNEILRQSKTWSTAFIEGSAIKVLIVFKAPFLAMEFTVFNQATPKIAACKDLGSPFELTLFNQSDSKWLEYRCMFTGACRYTHLWKPRKQAYRKKSRNIKKTSIQKKLEHQENQHTAKKKLVHQENQKTAKSWCIDLVHCEKHHIEKACTPWKLPALKVDSIKGWYIKKTPAIIEILLPYHA